MFSSNIAHEKTDEHHIHCTHSIFTFSFHTLFWFAVQKKSSSDPMFVVRGFLWPDTSWHLFGLRTSWGSAEKRRNLSGHGDVALWGPPPPYVSLLVISSVTLQQTNITMENHPFLIGDAFSCGCFSIVMLGFGGGITCHPHSLRGFLCHPTLLAGDWGQSTTSSKWRMILLQQIYRF